MAEGYTYSGTAKDGRLIEIRIPGMPEAGPQMTDLLKEIQAFVVKLDRFKFVDVVEAHNG